MSYPYDTPPPPFTHPPPPTPSLSPVPYSPVVPLPPHANHYAHPPPPPPVVGVAGTGAGAPPYHQFVSANYGGYPPAVPAADQPQKPSNGKKLAKVVGTFLCGLGKMAFYDEVLGDGIDF
ncbi:hypothetical protein FCV25MIE_16978 [Fagus crenata]